jgi:hypothetical protein
LPEIEQAATIVHRGSTEGVRDALSCGESVEPAAEAHQHAGGAEDIPDPVQQRAPAAQRPGVGQLGDRLFHQRA